MYKIMTPGPSKVRENVRKARSLEAMNPDLDKDFVIQYKSICDKLEKLMNCSGTCYIMDGEGILGLEAACASLTEKDDRVLVLDNGVFGEGFKDFVTMYGGTPVLYTADYNKPFDIEDLKKFLDSDSSFKYATVVHCDTPSGMLNPIEEICPLLHEYGILTVVDAVSSMFGEPVDFDNSCIDILCGGSQKALSAPSGLTMVWVSEAAMKAMESRRTPIASFYANILTFRTYYEDCWFPYTMPASDINGLEVAVDNIIADKDILKRHEEVASACRNAITASGLSLYPDCGYSNTVTAFQVPEGLTDRSILDIVRNDHDILLAGSFAAFAGKLIRIGHMGESANAEDVTLVMAALDDAFAKLGYTLNCSLKKTFEEKI